MTTKEFNELKEQLKNELKNELKADLKAELKTELLKELNNKAGFIVRKIPQSTGYFYVIQTDEQGNEIRVWNDDNRMKWFLEGAKEIAEQLRAGNPRPTTTHYRGYEAEPTKQAFIPAH